MLATIHTFRFSSKGVDNLLLLLQWQCLTFIITLSLAAHVLPTVHIN